MSYPIRAICVVDDLILVGRGNQLLIFDRQWECKAPLQFLRVGKPICAIKRLKCDTLVLVFGKSFQLLKLKKIESDQLKFEITGSEVFLRYWIIDCLPSCYSETENLSDEKSGGILFLLSSNVVLRYDLNSLGTSKIWKNEVPCILYSGLLFKDQKTRIVTAFSGTVFNTVLIWSFSESQHKVDQKLESEKVIISRRLEGHDGVIFNLDFDWRTQTVVTASDDRSIRIWQLPSENELTEVLHPLQTFYSHKARVQRVQFFKEFIISTGEDCVVCVLSRESLVAKFSAHNGLNIFGLEINLRSNYFLTGGEDGALLKWDVNSFQDDVTKFETLKGANEFVSEVSIVKFISSDEVLILTANGEIHTKSLHNDAYFSLIKTIVQLTNYAVCDVSDSHLILFGSLQGSVLSINLTSPEKAVCELQLSECKINSVHLIGEHLAITCAFDILYLISTESSSLVKVREYRWPVTRNNWPNCVCNLSDVYMACGDRNGTIWVYSLPKYELDDKSSTDKAHEPTEVITRAHSKLGLLSMVGNGSKLYTSGRDGKVNIFFIDSSKTDNSNVLKLANTIQMHNSVDWIAKLIFISKKLFAFCFKSENFLLVEVETSRTISKIPCGGGHRSFDIMLSQKAEEFRFVFMKKSEVCYVKSSIINARPFTQLLPALHGVKIHCLEIIRKSGTCFVITGAEDNTIRISEVTNFENHLMRCVSIIDCSPCTVRTLKAVELDESKYLLLAFGSRCMKAFYKVNIHSDACQKIQVQRVMFDCSSKNEESDDCKYLSADFFKDERTFVHMFISSSHGYVDSISFITKNLGVSQLDDQKIMKLSTKTIYRPNSDEKVASSINVIKCLDLSFKHEKLLCFGDNFGVLRYGNLTDPNGQDAIDVTDLKLEWLDLSKELGRVTCMESMNEKVLLGGDSANLVLCNLNPNSRRLEPMVVITGCHAAQVVSCQIYLSLNKELFMCSVSIDQRVKIFSLGCENYKRSTEDFGEGVTILLASEVETESFRTGIEDPSCSRVIDISDTYDERKKNNWGKMIVVAGEGVGFVS